MQAIKTVGRGSAHQRSRLRSGLVAAQVGVSFVLLVVAGLLSRSLLTLHRADPGFAAQDLLTVEVPLPPRSYDGEARTRFFATLVERIRAIPGVHAAGAISQLPLRNPDNDISVYDAATPPANVSDRGNGYHRLVLPGYFQAMGIPLVAGRDIQLSDTQSSRRVVVISQVLAEQLFPGMEPLGRNIVVDGASDQPWEVVGIVTDIKASRLSEPRGSRGAFYRPHAQIPESTMRLAIRASVAPETLVPAVRAVLQDLDSNVPLAGPRTMQQVIDHATIGQKAQAIVLAAFSALAVVLAAAGIYGLLAYRVRQQQRDIGIRMALGADPRAVARAVFRHAGRLVLLGSMAGIAGAWGVSRLIRGSLYGVGPNDPFVYGAVVLAMVGLTTLAAWLPARRATRVNPVEALRAE